MACGAYRVLIVGLNTECNTELQDGDSRVTILRFVARFQWGEQKRKKSLSNVCDAKRGPVKGASSTENRQKVRHPSIKRLDRTQWHSTDICLECATTQPAPSIWPSLAQVLVLFFFWCMRRSRVEDPRTRWKWRSGHSLWCLYNVSAAIKPTCFYFVVFFHLRCNKACLERLRCYCSVEIDSLMRPFSENVMHMNYNGLCSCLHLLQDEGGAEERRGPNSY